MEPTLQQIVAWTKAAGKIARDGFNAVHTIGYKGATDVVTEVDHACEKLLMESILAAFPNHTIMTEETGEVKGHADHCWHIDPLDGTINYSHQIPIYSISVAYEHQGQLKLGVVYDPARDECFSAELGKGAWLNGQPIHASNVTELAKSLLVTGLPHNEPDESKLMKRMLIFGHLTNITQGVRRLGSAAIDCCYVACGRLDGYWEEKINAWDIAAGSLICCEAGAAVTSLQGDPNWFKPPFSLLICSPGLKKLLLEQVNRTE